MSNPILRIGNSRDGKRPAHAHMRMVRYANRNLGEYSYNVFDPSKDDGVGKLMTVDEIQRFFGRIEEAWDSKRTPPLDPRATTGATMFAVLDEDEEYHVRTPYNAYPEKMEKGRSWGKNDDTTDSVGLNFELYSPDAGGNTVWFDNARYEVSNILWEFSPDGGRTWFPLYDIPGRPYTRMSFPYATNMIRARLNSNNPQEWWQALAISPKPDYQMIEATEMRWNTADGVSDFKVSDIGYATWTEAIGGNGTYLYSIVDIDDESGEPRVMGQTRRTSYQIDDYDATHDYGIIAHDSHGSVLRSHTYTSITNVEIHRLGERETEPYYVGFSDTYYATFNIGGVHYDSRYDFGNIDLSWSTSTPDVISIDGANNGTCIVDYSDESAAASIGVNVRYGTDHASLDKVFRTQYAIDTEVDFGYFYYSDQHGNKLSDLQYISANDYRLALFKDSPYILLNPLIRFSNGKSLFLYDKHGSRYLGNIDDSSLVDFEIMTGVGVETLLHWKGTTNSDNNKLWVSFREVQQEELLLKTSEAYAEVSYIGMDGERFYNQLNMVGITTQTYTFNAYARRDGETSFNYLIEPREFITSIDIEGSYPGQSALQEGITVTVTDHIRITFPEDVKLSEGRMTVHYASPVAGESEQIINFMFSYY